MRVSFDGAGLINVGNGFAPVFLFFKGSLESDQLVVVELEGVSGLFEDGIGGGDEGVESGLLVGKRVLLVGEVVGEGFPIVSLILFGTGIVSSGFSNGGEDLVEEVDDVDDVLIVKFGGELGKRQDEGLEEGAELGGLTEGVLDLFEAGLDLGEGNTVDQMFDQFDGLIELVFGGFVFEVEVDPAGVFSFSLGVAGFQGGDGFIVVGGGEVEVSLGTFQNFTVGFDGVFQRFDGGGFSVDLVGQRGDQFVASGLVGFVVGISFSLVLLDGIEVGVDGFLNVGNVVILNGGLKG